MLDFDNNEKNRVAYLRFYQNLLSSDFAVITASAIVGTLNAIPLKKYTPAGTHCAILISVIFIFFAFHSMN